ncbi:ScyD/ScyE family protein [uncultured Nocardioides sp.]|uniref:ScyD/ScyE family protein n=1 Tax=uncultured Nocardioides sp. TaxID=198441 RepID=UPI002618D1B6|nr:ScyD/ScyE family protein [uncultured Nocardioides sp.]HRD59854.1 ScyD/ScyE family protein [Nocardioides sp.]
MSTRHVLAVAAAGALVVGAAGAALTGASAAPAQKAKPTVTTIAKKLVGPLSVAQAPDGTIYYADSFAGVLYKRTTAGVVSVIYKSKKNAADGVSADGGVVRFVTGSPDNKAGGVWTLDSAGAPVQLGDTYKYEKKHNPDGKFSYGFLNTPKSCLAQLPKQIPGSYKGTKETHAYAVATAGDITYVADAGANAILAMSATGEFSTVAALKPVKVKVSAGAAKANGLPSCVVGKKFALEAVPTDIEVGPDGMLYVTSLPGGPEDGSLGVNGRVLRVNPTTGKVKTVVGGLLSPTGVAVAANGDIYVAQLFKGEISKIKAGKTKVRPYLQVPLPAAVEITPTGMLASINALPGKKPKGKVVTITP